MGWDFWSTQLATIGIPNIAWKERQYERHIGTHAGQLIQPGGEVETVIRLLRPGLGGGEQALST